MKLIKMSLAAATAVSMAVAGGDIAPVQEVAPEAKEMTIADAFANGDVSGQIRAFYISRDRDGSQNITRNALAVGGHLKYVTAPYHGFSLGVAFYTTNEISDLGQDHEHTNATLFGEDKEGYSILGEFYLNYKNGNTNVKIGRQKLNTPLAGADDARMLPNLFEAAVLSNTDIEDTTLIAAHVTKMAAGSFSNAYWDLDSGNVDGFGNITTRGAITLSSGYGLNNISGKFMNMGTYAIGEETDGVTALAAIYTGIDGVKLQAWDYYAHDILNAIYLQADASMKVNDGMKVFGAAQLISQTEVGDALAGDIDSTYWGVKAGAGIAGFTGYVAYSQTDSSNGTIDGGIITPWGGMPAFTQGMVTRHQFFADTDTVKVAGTYNFADMGLKATAYYAKYDVGTENSYLGGLEAEETGFDVIYQATKELQLRVRGNYARDFVSGLDWDEYRVIANYNF